MLELTIGLVCEGKTDYLIFEKLLSRVFDPEKVALSFRQLQPARDATSGSYGEGGWRQVFQWCVRNEPDARRRLFAPGGLFEGPQTKACDLLIVHLDGDVCAALSRDGTWRSVDAPNPTGLEFSNAAAHGQYLEEVINSWLKSEQDTTEYKDRNVAATAIMAVETWTLCELDLQEELESIQDPKNRFIDLVHQLQGRARPANMKKFRQPLKAYTDYVNNAKIDIEKIKQRCPHFKKLADAVGQKIAS